MLCISYFLPINYLSNCIICSGAELACAIIDWAACNNISLFVFRVTSKAISVSLIFDSDEIVFSAELSKLFTTYCNLFWYAPKAAVWSDTFLVASSIIFIALSALFDVVTSNALSYFLVSVPSVTLLVL